MSRAMNGAKLVLPGPHLDGASLYELFEAEGVTLEPRRADGVARLRGASAATGARCSTLRRILSGGSAVPPSMFEAFDRRGITVCQGWGMTEMSPVGTTALLMAKHADLDPARCSRSARSRAGRCSAST